MMAHEIAHILHRDISAGNIMIKEIDGEVVGILIDWDMAKDLDNPTTKDDSVGERTVSINHISCCNRLRPCRERGSSWPLDSSNV